MAGIPKAQNDIGCEALRDNYALLTMRNEAEAICKAHGFRVRYPADVRGNYGEPASESELELWSGLHGKTVHVGRGHLVYIYAGDAVDKGRSEAGRQQEIDYNEAEQRSQILRNLTWQDEYTPEEWERWNASKEKEKLRRQRKRQRQMEERSKDWEEWEAQERQKNEEHQREGVRLVQNEETRGKGDVCGGDQEEHAKASVPVSARKERALEEDKKLAKGSQ